MWPLEITPQLESDIVKVISERIGSPHAAERVKRTSKSRPVTQCYYNVADVVTESGGSLVLGWAIMYWPQHYVIAMHHAVWRNSAGRLLDVTAPQPPDSSASHTIFVRDNRFPMDGNWNPIVPDVVVPLTDDPVVLDYISTNSLHLVLKGKLIDLSKQHGAIMFRVDGKMVVGRPSDIKVSREVEESIR